MVELYEQTGGNIIAVQECDPAETHKYGIVGRGEDVGIPASRSPTWSRSRSQGTAPSNLYINGRYILQPEIFTILEDQERGAGNEIQLTDAMLKLEKQQDFYGYHYQGRTYRLRLAGRLHRGQCRLRAVARRTCTTTWPTSCRTLLDEMKPSERRGAAALQAPRSSGVLSAAASGRGRRCWRRSRGPASCWSASRAAAGR